MWDHERVVPADIELHPIAPDEAVYQLLAANNLPTADIESPDCTLYGVTISNERIGIGGYEIHGSTGLLRSIAVHTEIRGCGIGTTICLKLEDHLACNMCDTIYLLTDDAAEFFESVGYERIDQATAPESIQHTHEFADSCPATTVCLMKTI